MRRLTMTKKGSTGTGIPTISAAGLKRKLDRGEDVVALDVRQPDGYTDYPGRIPGSVRIPPADIPDRYRELPRDSLIVPHCT